VIVVLRQLSNFSAISWREKVNCQWDGDDVRTRTYKLSWSFTVLVHWNNSPRTNISTHSDTLSWFRANQYFLFLL